MRMCPIWMLCVRRFAISSFVRLNGSLSLTKDETAHSKNQRLRSEILTKDETGSHKRWDLGAGVSHKLRFRGSAASTPTFVTSSSFWRFLAGDFDLSLTGRG